MLILTRRIGESLIIGGTDSPANTDDGDFQAPSASIVIGDSVVNVKVLGVKGCQVRLGIEAPKHVSVHREEIYQRIQQEKGQSTYAADQEEYETV